MIGLVLTLSVVFAFVGYAEVVDNRSIYGSATFEEPKAFYISAVTPLDPSAVTIKSYASTVLSSTFMLAGNRCAEQVIRVTVRNNTSNVYGYSATLRQAGIDPNTYSNADIVYNVYANEAYSSATTQALIETRVRELQAAIDAPDSQVAF